MTSYEKYMFFIPNRLFADEDEMFVSFNVAVIPKDMNVTSMILCVPLPARNMTATLYAHVILSGWDENTILRTRPSYNRRSIVAQVAPHSKEGSIVLTEYAPGWRFKSVENHGLFVQLESFEALSFSEDNPPYLLVATE